MLTVNINIYIIYSFKFINLFSTFIAIKFNQIKSLDINMLSVAICKYQHLKLL